MRKLKYYVAMSLDGYIADEEGSFDTFIAEGEHVKDYLDSLQAFDIVLMGLDILLGVLAKPAARHTHEDSKPHDLGFLFLLIRADLLG